MVESKGLQPARRCGYVFTSLSAILWLGTTVCFIGRWDPVTAITTFPQWVWAVFGVLAALIASRLLKGRKSGVLVATWLVTTLAFSDNLISMMRAVAGSYRPSASASTGSLRIATLNCASSSAAAAEVMQWKPEIILLQESPPSNEVIRLAREWFGEAASYSIGLDCAIVSVHAVKATRARPEVHYTQGIVLLPGNREVLVTSLRLTPPVGRIDLWRPSTWRLYSDDRRLRTRQLQAVLNDCFKHDLPQIIGGDFNAPAGDGIYKLMSTFRDCHRAAGRGWGNTAMNTIPLFRPDQVWVNRLAPVSAHAVRTVHSDHRMVIADVSVRAN